MELTEAGFYKLPPGKLATIVTSLEMHARPPTMDDQSPAAVELVRWSDPDIEEYRQLYRYVGEQWLWFSRLRMSDDDLAAVISHPKVHVFRLICDHGAQGLLELDFRQRGECELAFFGLSQIMIGKGVGGWLMREALQRAWAPGITRVWVHTCTLDHPSALGFYRHCGFVPFDQEVEVLDDPRLDGTLSKTAAPHIPSAKLATE